MSNSTVDSAANTDSEANALHAKCEAIRVLDDQGAKQEIGIRYKIAKHCKDIVEGDGTGKRYGDHAVEQAAQKLGWSPTEIYAHAQVAQTWTEAEVMDLHTSKRCRWRHLEILARDKVKPQREKLIEDIAGEGLSVRALQQKVAARSSPASHPASANYLADVSPSVPVVTGIQDYAANVAHFESEARSYVDRLRASVAAAAPEDLTPAALQQLRQLRQRRKAAYEYDLKAIEDCIAKAQKATKSKGKATTAKTRRASPAISNTAAKAAPAVAPKAQIAGAVENSARAENVGA